MGGYRIYLAYGSNLNLAQMYRRCPDSMLLAVGTLCNHELLFKGRYGNCYCTVEPCPCSVVPVGIFLVSDRDVKSLDRYEGVPKHYRRVNVNPADIYIAKSFDEIPDLPVFMYAMNAEMGGCGAPSDLYYETVQKGYMDCCLDTRYLEYALDKSIDIAMNEQINKFNF